MDRTLLKIVKGEPLSQEDIEEILYKICDREHSGCGYSCPVYELNGGKVPDSFDDFEKNRGCDCFKSGKAMRQFILKRIEK
jgi:hypothetical protein